MEQLDHRMDILISVPTKGFDPTRAAGIDDLRGLDTFQHPRKLSSEQRLSE